MDQNLNAAASSSSSKKSLSKEGGTTVAASTPLIKLANIPKLQGFQCQFYAKLECNNPLGCSSVRLARNLIWEYVESSPSFIKGSTVISRGTPVFSLALTWVCTTKGLRCKSIFPRKENEKVTNLIEALGGSSVTVPFNSSDIRNEDSNSENVNSSCNIMKSLQKAISHSFIIDPCDPNATGIMRQTQDQILEEIHYQAKEFGSPQFVFTGPNEIGMLYKSTNRKDDNKDNDKCFEIVGVDYSKNCFIPDSERLLLNSDPTQRDDFVTQWLESTDAESYEMARRLHREEGILVGPRAGAILAAAMKQVEKTGVKDNADAVVVVVLSDSLWYQDMSFLQESWMLDKGYFRQEKMESLYWWWNMPVADMPLQKPLIASSKVSLKEVLKRSEESNSCCSCDFVLVQNLETLEILGMFYRDEAQLAIKNGQLNEHDPVSKLPLIKNLTELPVSARCWELQNLFLDYHWIAIVTQREQYDEDGVSKPFKQIMGVIENADVIVHTRTLEMTHKAKWGLDLTDGVPFSTWFDENWSGIGIV